MIIDIIPRPSFRPLVIAPRGPRGTAVSGRFDKADSRSSTAFTTGKEGGHSLSKFKPMSR